MILRRTVLGILAAAASARMAAADVWVRLGARDVLLANDRDRILVSGAAGSFTAIRLEVRGSGVFFEDLDITFGNGERRDVPIRAFIPDGGSTRVIDLAGRARNIRHVDLRYRRAAGGGRAAVVLFGRRG